MNHSPYFRSRPEADTAVLMIHGILSTPRHFDWLLPYIPNEYEVNSILLAGHGGTVKDFSKATMQQWHQQTEAALTDMERPGRRIFVVGHSLGSLLALETAKTHASIQGLLLLNVPLAPRVKLSMIGRSLRFAFGKIRTDDPTDRLCYQDLGVQLEPYLWKYLGWVRNFISLLALARKSRKIPATLKIPSYVYLGKKDEVVSPRTHKWLQNDPYITVQMLENGGHYGYSEQEKASIAAGLSSMLKIESRQMK